MNKNDKAKILKFLSDELNKSKVYLFAEFSGLSVSEMQELRKEIRKVFGNVMVVKNTLFKRVFQTLPVSMDEADKFMEGPNILIWSRTGDESEIIKEVLRFAKRSNKLKLKFGILNHLFLDSGSIEQIGNLPAKKILQAIVISGIRSPINNLVYNVKYPITRLIMVLKTFSEKKGEKNG